MKRLTIEFEYMNRIYETLKFAVCTIILINKEIDKKMDKEKGREIEGDRQ